MVFWVDQVRMRFDSLQDVTIKSVLMRKVSMEYLIAISGSVALKEVTKYCRPTTLTSDNKDQIRTAHRLFSLHLLTARANIARVTARLLSGSR